MCDDRNGVLRSMSRVGDKLYWYLMGRRSDQVRGQSTQSTIRTCHLTYLKSTYPVECPVSQDWIISRYDCEHFALQSFISLRNTAVQCHIRRYRGQFCSYAPRSFCGALCAFLLFYIPNFGMPALTLGQESAPVIQKCHHLEFLGCSKC